MKNKWRLIIALLIGVVAGCGYFFIPTPTYVNGVKLGDLIAPLFSMEYFVSGSRPVYGGQFYGSTPAGAYPFTAMVFLYPFLFIPLQLIGPLFCAICSTIFAYALLFDNKPWRLFVLGSPAYLMSLYSVQFAPLMSSAFFLPCLLPLAILKPQLGVVLMASGEWSKKTFCVMVLIIMVTLLLYPSWPIDWIKNSSLATYATHQSKIPILQIGGFILLLSLFKWRNRRARLLSAMSVIPQRLWYDQLMLFLLPDTRQELYILLIGSWISFFLSIAGGWFFKDQMQHPMTWTLVVFFLYMPALYLIFKADIVVWINKLKNFYVERP